MALLVIVTRDISSIEITSEHHRRVNRKTPLSLQQITFSTRRKYHRTAHLRKMDKRSVTIVLHRQLSFTSYIRQFIEIQIKNQSTLCSHLFQTVSTINTLGVKVFGIHIGTIHLPRCIVIGLRDDIVCAGWPF